MEQFEELSLKRLAEIIFKHIGMIIAITLISGILAFVYSETMIVPEYESSVSIYVNNKNTREQTQILTSDIAASQMLVDTYVVIVKSDTVLNRVVEQLTEAGLKNYSVGSLRSKITASSVNSTEILEIKVRDTDAGNSFIIANMIAEVAPDIIKDFVEASSVKIVDYAVIGTKVSPNIQNNMILGLIFGLFISCAFFILREIFDMRIKNEEELEGWFHLPILGIIPDIGTSIQSTRKGYYSYRRSSKAYEYKRGVKDNAGKSAKANK